MNELLSFVAKNHDKLVLSDRQALVKISNQIEALKKVKDQKEKNLSKQAIEQTLKGLEKVAQTTRYSDPGHTSPYVDPKNRAILQNAVAIARRLLREA